MSKRRSLQKVTDRGRVIAESSRGDIDTGALGAHVHYIINEVSYSTDEQDRESNIATNYLLLFQQILAVLQMRIFVMFTT